MRILGFVIAVALLFGQAPVRNCVAAPCTDYRDAPHVTGRCDSGGANLTLVCASGDFAYASSGPDLYVIDAVDPANPVLAGWVGLTGIASEIAVSANHVWAAIGVSGLVGIDVSDPAHPRIVGSVGMPGSAVALDVAGSYAYVATGNGLQIVAIANPAAPQLRGAVSIPGAAGVAVVGEYAYVLAPESGFYVVSVANPGAPRVVGSVACNDYTRVAASANCAVISFRNGLAVVDTHDPGNPRIMGTLWSGTADPWFNDLAVQGEYAYIANVECMQILDLSQLSAPEFAGSVFMQRSAWGLGVAVSGDRAYVTCGSGGVNVIDISHPDEPPAVGKTAMMGDPVDMAVTGNYGYIAGYTGGLFVIDLADVSHPTVVLVMRLQGAVINIAVSGDYAYVVDWSGLYVMDISDPPLPRILAYMPLGGLGDAVAAGTHVFVAHSSGLSVIDVSNPRDPILVTELTTAGPVQNQTISGRYLYAAELESGLEVIDILDPAHPRSVANVSVPGYAMDVAVSGNHASVADELGVREFDITDPENPLLIGGIDTPGPAERVAVSGDYAYVAGVDDVTELLQVLDLGNPAEPVLLGTRGSPGGAWTTVVTDYVFCLEGGTGGPGLLNIRPLQCSPNAAVPPELRGRPSLTAFPNPARDRLNLRIDLPHPGRVQVDVFDISGRRVRGLLNGALGAGPQILTWRGEDEKGRPVASGAYLIRLRNANGSVTTRSVIAR